MQNSTLDLSSRDLTSINIENQEPKSLLLSHNLLEKIENLNIKSLEVLEVDFNLLVTAQIQCSNLVRISLAHNRLNFVSINSKAIQHLDLRHNQIEKVDFISQMRDLRYLNLSYNLIKKVDFLIFNLKLDELHLDHNQIESLKQSFENTPQLRILNLEHNRIDSIKFIDKLPQLEQLLISNNSIKQIDITNNNESLQILDLSYNILSEISIIELKYPCITHLYVDNNDILGDCEVSFLFQYKNLIEVSFDENPFFNRTFESQIIVDCPWLQIVNGKEVSKPAAYIRQEILKIKKELEDGLQKEQIQFDNDDDQVDESDMMTEEKLKAILHLQGEDIQEDESMLRTSKIFQDQLLQESQELDVFLTSQHEEMLKLRSKYMSLSSYKQQHTKESIDKQSPRYEIQTEPQVQLQKSIAVQKQKPSAIIKSVMGSAPKPQKSILSEISQIKSSMKNKEFYQSLGFTQQRLSQERQAPQRMNSSSENFNKRPSSKNKVQSASIKLPKIQ